MEIRTSFTTLRQTANRIVQVVSDICGIDKKEISISSSINNDLGIDGDDWTDLQKALQRKASL